MGKFERVFIRVIKYASYVMIPLLALYFILQGFIDKIWDWRILSDGCGYVIFLFLINIIEGLQRSIDKRED